MKSRRQNSKASVGKIKLSISMMNCALQQEKQRAESIIRLQAEELRKTRDHYLTILEEFPALIWRADTSGLCNYFNKTWLDFTGRTMKQELGNGWSEGVHPDDFQRCLDIFLSNLEKRKAFDMEYRLRRHDGEYRTISDHGAPMFASDGTFTGYLGSCYDIHDKKMLEDRLRHSHKMEAIGILAGGVAHDFNNILSVIMGYSGMLLMQIPPENPMNEQLQAVVDAARRASELTHNLLTFSRKHEADTEIIDLCEATENFKKFLQRLIGENISLTTALKDCPLRVSLSHGLFEQILMNLAVNARDAMPDGGQLIIEACRTELEKAEAAVLELPSDKYACITVSDTGYGIKPELLSKVFDPFFTTKDIGKGCGMGLSMIYGTVRQHGGNIGIESKLLHGTTVTVYLPLATGTAA